MLLPPLFTLVTCNMVRYIFLCFLIAFIHSFFLVLNLSHFNFIVILFFLIKIYNKLVYTTFIFKVFYI